MDINIELTPLKSENRFKEIVDKLYGKRYTKHEISSALEYIKEYNVEFYNEGDERMKRDEALKEMREQIKEIEELLEEIEEHAQKYEEV